jgi:hypothetical protein
MRVDAAFALRMQKTALEYDRTFRSIWLRYAHDIGMEPVKLEKLVDMLVLASNSIGVNVFLGEAFCGCFDSQAPIQQFQILLSEMIDAELLRCLR